MDLKEFFRRLITRQAPGLVDATAVANIFGLGSEIFQTQKDVNFWRGIFYRCVDLRASAVAEAMSLSRVVRRIDQSSFVKVEPTHPWVTLLARPHPQISAYELWYWVSLSRDVYGEAYLVAERDRLGRVVALYPIYPAFGTMEARVGSSGAIEEYVYRSAMTGRQITFGADEVVDLSVRDPADPRKTISMITKMYHELEADLYQHAFRSNYLKSGGISPFYIRVEGLLSEPQRRRMQQEFESHFMGWRNARKIPVLTMADIKSVAASARDIEYSRGTDAVSRLIMRIMGVPEGMLGGDANRANAEAARAVFTQNTAMPLARMIAERVTIELEEAFRAQRGVLLVQPDDIVPVDGLTLSRRRQIEVMIGMRSPNELRAEDGLPPYEGGDRYYMAANLIEVTSDPMQQPQSGAGQGPKEVGRSFTPVLSRRLIVGMAREAERELAETLGEMLERIGRDITKHLERDFEISPDLASYFLGIRDEARRQAMRIAEEAVRYAEEAFASAASGSIPYMYRRRIEDALARHAEFIAASIDRRMARLLEKAITEGWNADQFRAAAAQTIQEMRKGRARVWAASLATTTVNGGLFAAYDVLGVERVRWRAVRDQRTRPHHFVADGLETEFGKPFVVGGEQMLFPGDMSLGATARNIANCRCWIEPSVNGQAEE